MALSTLQSIGILCLSALVLYLLVMRYDPQRPHARYLRQSVSGFLLLTAWNWLPLPRLGVNPLSVMVTGALGLSGAGLMAVISMLP